MPPPQRSVRRLEAGDREGAHGQRSKTIPWGGKDGGLTLPPREECGAWRPGISG